MSLKRRLDNLETIYTPERKHPVQPAPDKSYYYHLPESPADLLAWLKITRRYVEKGLIGFAYHPAGARVTPDFMRDTPFDWRDDLDLTACLALLDWIYREFPESPHDVPGLLELIDMNITALEKQIRSN